MTVSSTGGAEVAPAHRILPRRPLAAAIGMTIFLAILWAIEVVDQTFVSTSADPMGLDSHGIVARDVDGLTGILFAPLLHGGYEHLASNSVPLFILGFLVLAGGLGQFLAVTAVIWLLGGFATWLTGAPGVTIGFSGIIFGWLAFLLVRGFFNRSAKQIVLAIVLFLFYGGLLFGVLPTQPGVSWQAHLFGALAGVVAARLTVAADRAGTAT